MTKQEQAAADKLAAEKAAADKLTADKLASDQKAADDKAAADKAAADKLAAMTPTDKLAAFEAEKSALRLRQREVELDSEEDKANENRLWVLRGLIEKETANVKAAAAAAKAQEEINARLMLITYYGQAVTAAAKIIYAGEGMTDDEKNQLSANVTAAEDKLKNELLPTHKSSTPAAGNSGNGIKGEKKLAIIALYKSLIAEGKSDKEARKAIIEPVGIYNDGTAHAAIKEYLEITKA